MSLVHKKTTVVKLIRTSCIGLIISAFLVFQEQKNDAHKKCIKEHNKLPYDKD